MRVVLGNATSANDAANFQDRPRAPPDNHRFSEQRPSSQRAEREAPPLRVHAENSSAIGGVKNPSTAIREPPQPRTARLGEQQWLSHSAARASCQYERRRGQRPRRKLGRHLAQRNGTDASPDIFDTSARNRRLTPGAETLSQKSSVNQAAMSSRPRVNAGEVLGHAVE
jgi:hypothetical protein